MIDLLIILAVNILCFWAGYRLGLRVAVVRMIANILKDPTELQNAIKEYSKAVAQEQAQTQRQGVRELRVELHGGHYYLYAKDTDEFLGQGSTLEAAMELVAQRYPGVEFMANKGRTVQP